MLHFMDNNTSPRTDILQLPKRRDPTKTSDRLTPQAKKSGSEQLDKPTQRNPQTTNQTDSKEVPFFWNCPTRSRLLLHNDAPPRVCVDTPTTDTRNKKQTEEPYDTPTAEETRPPNNQERQAFDDLSHRQRYPGAFIYEHPGQSPAFDYPNA